MTTAIPSATPDETAIRRSMLLHRPLSLAVLLLGLRHASLVQDYDLEPPGLQATTPISSPDEVRLRAREQLRKGASQIKLMAGGGVASPYNPIESTQYSGPEIRAVVEVADNWGTYVTVHA